MSGREHSGLSMKLKLAVGAIVTLLAVAAIVGYVTVTHHGSSAASTSAAVHRRSVDSDQSKKDAVYSHEIQSEISHEDIQSRSRFTRQAQPLSRDTSQGVRNPNYGQDMSCFTDPNNNTVPAAHVKGHAGRFQVPQGYNNLPGYVQRWKCADFRHDTPRHPGLNTHAFVDGGMCFNQTEKKLIVPKCGYYHVFSQILFQCKKAGSSSEPTSIKHLLKFDRNCPDWEETSIGVMGVAHVNMGAATTTHASDVIKLCKGGKIWVEIPETENDVCYPTGDDHATFMGAVLVTETTCHWPPDTKLCNLDHSHDGE